MKLLICIAHHYTKESLPFLCKVISIIQTEYKCDYKIVIQTNSNQALDFLYRKFSNIEVIVYYNLLHPYHLTWQHRHYMKEHINEYDVFMYLEDDMIIHYEQYTNYLDNFYNLWPTYVPAFVRFELNDNLNKKYIVDLGKITYNKTELKCINNKFFYKIHRVYNGCWVCPKEQLKSKIDCADFTDSGELHLTRERAASLVTWSLNNNCLVEIKQKEDTFSFSELSLIHHSTNKYVHLKDLPFSKYTNEEIFSKI